MSETDRVATPNGPLLRRSRRTACENPWITIWHDEVSRPDGSPGIEVRWVPFDEALVMAADGRITDAMSFIGLQRVALDRLGAAGRDSAVRVDATRLVSAPGHER